MDINKLLKTQKALHEQLVKAATNHKKSAKAKRTESYFNLRIENFSSIWTMFQHNHALIYQSESPSAEEYIKSSLYEDTEDIYIEYVSEFKEELKTFKTNESKPSSSFDTSKSEIKLPTITIPKFDGTYQSWRSFHDLFKSIVHKDHNLSKVQKLHYLKTCVTGEAERLLRQFDITENNYQQAWDFLYKRYNNTRVLVNTQLKLLLNQPNIKTESSQAIKNFLDQTEESLHELRALNIPTENWDAILVYTLVQKLPPETHYQWEQEQGNKTEIPSYSDLVAFLESRFRTLEALQDCKSNNPPHKQNAKNTYTFLNKPTNCPKCKQNHTLFHCQVFRKLIPNQRLTFIQQNKLCKNCLASGHTTAACLSKKTCLKCQRRHNTLLHLETQPKAEREQPKQETQENHEDAPQSFFSTNFKKALLSTALVEAESPTGETRVLRALIDSGSQVSFITEAASKKLQLKKNPTSMEVTGLGKTQTAYINSQVSFKVKSLHSTFQIETTALVLKKITDSIPSNHINVSKLNYIQNIQLADPKFFSPGSIDLLLGADIYAKIIENGVIKGEEGNPTAQNTQLGWILMGKITHDSSTINTFTIQVNATQRLEEQIKKFWEQEEITTKVTHPDDDLCEEIYQKTHKRLSNGHYLVKLPFRNSEGPVLGQSRHIAIKQYYQLEKRLAKDKELSNQYKNCIDEYLKLEHMKEISHEPNKVEEQSENRKHYYLPHHAVLKESSTTKLRVVFNASSKTSNGKSLNEQLLVGPTIQATLWTILLKWRSYKFAFTADIEKMYRMIHMHEDHQPYQRILWRDNLNEPIKDYQLTTVTFGTTSAPYLAVRTLHQLARDEQSNFPLAAQSILNDFYVDDLLTGSHDIDSGLQLQKQLITVLQRGGFNLRKWTANHPSLLKDIPSEHREIKAVLSWSEHTTIKTLGIQWHPSTDEFSFSVKIPLMKTQYTKRSVLSETASLFDPLGWLAPCIIIAKILIQRLWLTGLLWDDPLPESISNEWIKFRKELSDLKDIRIPRWIHFSQSAQNIQLHGFCDASNHAYAAVLYLRVSDENGTVNVSLLTSKTRVAPTKPVSLPRLELCGALTLARLIKQVTNDMKLSNIPIHAWTDSEITLAWIQGQPTRWKTYVANRVAEIQENISPRSWHHVSSKDNPADCASRGLQPTDLLRSNIWWHGPPWLSSNEWQHNNNTFKTTELEVRKIKTFTCTIKDQPWILKQSSFPKLIRITAYCLRFVKNCRSKTEERQFNFLTCKELQLAELKLITLVQKISFPAEYHNLSHSKPISRKSHLLCLNPFIADDQAIRVGGRLENSSLTYNQKHPIILPNKHHISNLIIDYYHLYTLHGGTQLVLNTLRNKYWLINARNTIRQRIHQCIACFRTNPKPTKQIMSDLPPPRVNPSLPFEHTGIDYAGPIGIKTSKLRNAKIVKGYLCIFICLATKAIHIEIVSELTTAGFIAALKRFTGRRGLCSNLYSDCGTNFVGAKKRLASDIKQALNIMPEEIATEMSNIGITWHFNPPAAPHFGGLWEAGVKLIKTHLKKVLQGAAITFEELSTVICQIEACINSRPLSPLSNDPSDYNVLTPGHFLTGRNLLHLPEPDFTKNVSSLKRWQYTQQLMQQFWKNWTKQYLNNLQQRTKWRTSEENLKIHDLVLIIDNRYPPMNWPLGRIINIHPGKDKRVRVATIKTSNNCFLRPVTKLCKLPIIS